MRYFIFLIVFSLCSIGAMKTNADSIVNWLLGINFTLAIFSINFTFFGQQLSKYKALYHSISRRQWINIYALVSLPFVPLICYLLSPEYFGNSALIIMPILMFSALDNAILTTNYLNPKKYLDNQLGTQVVSHYINRVSKLIEVEVKEHQNYIDNKDKFQIPTHAYSFEPTSNGCQSNDLWDSIMTVIKLSLQNNDYPVFKQSISATLKLLISFYTYQHHDKDNYRVSGGMKSIARNRLRSIIKHVKNEDVEGVFLHTLSNELCRFLKQDEVLESPCSELASAISADAVWVGKAILETQNSSYPIIVLNTIHSIIEMTIYKLANSKEDDRRHDLYNITMYAYQIKELGIHAFKNDNPHFAYRCMESLSYLGCNAAKIKSANTLEVVFESISQLGRVARSLKIDCFWHRCLIPVESHAEEFMGHILTWMIKDLDDKGNFFMKEYAEQAYSRLRGIQCEIVPQHGSSPCRWIKEITRDGNTIPHIEEESGMHGYSGKLDYSNFENLKEYALMGISPSSGSKIIRTAPVPIKFELEGSATDTE